MTTITATPDTATGSIVLSISKTATVTKVVRINVNGAEEVRASTSQLPSTGTGTLILTDYEAAEGLNTYNAYATDGSFVTASATLTLDKPWLLVPIAPHYSMQAEVITNYSAGMNSFSTVHRVIGRSDPLVTLGRLSTRQGMLELWAENLEEANALARVFSRGEIVQLKQAVAGMDMYFTADGISIDPYSVEGPDNTKYRFTIQYTEVARPFGDLAGALGWTYETLAADFASYDSVLAGFASYDDLTLGDEI